MRFEMEHLNGLNIPLQKTSHQLVSVKALFIVKIKRLHV